MTDGLILLGIVAVAFGLVVARFRRRLGIGGTGKTFISAVCGFAIAVLLLWVMHRH